MFVDGKKQRAADPEAQCGYLDWVLREPHSLDMMRKTAQWLFTEEGLKEDLSLDLIKRLHKSAYPHQDDLLVTWNACLPYSVRLFGEYTPAQKIVLNARAQEIQRITGSDKAPWKCEDGVISSDWNFDESEKYVPILLQNYLTKMSELRNPEELSRAIVQIIHDLEDIHIFGDGNCRVLQLLLNRELVKYGM